ncbi:hypothetical protein TTRE_0000149901 [Trichuris trichiura]|uniref:PDZ domain-containing protein n=1 Tax=Trichuris trichiura TaxID=36087 RepID=A0A077Z3E2_TRITR|nr:hypothetical protein TTRE_0000149901 [Trichuris trichiura]
MGRRIPRGSHRPKNHEKIKTEKGEIITPHDKKTNAARQSLSAAYINPTLFRNVQKIKVDAPKNAKKIEDKNCTRAKPSVPAVIVPTTIREDDYSAETFEDDFEEYEEDDAEVSPPKNEHQELAVHTDSAQVEYKRFTADDSPKDQNQSHTLEKAIEMPSTAEELPTIDFSKTAYNEDHWLAMQLLEERSIALRSYVQLDCETYNLCSIPPNEEESTFWYYSRAAGVEHKCLQTGDDNVDKDTETASPFMEGKQTQHPMVRNFACTGDSESSGQISAFNGMEQREQCKKFVSHASALLMRLIRSQRSKFVPKLGHSTQPFSKGSASLSLGLLGKRCRVACTSMSSFAGKFKCIVGYQIEESALDSFERMGMLSIWGFKELDKPQKLLLCEAEPTCCLLYEECAWTIAASGMDDGTVALWDLGEPDCWHRTIPWKESDVTVRRPTYDTAFFCGDDKDMCSKVVDILILNVQKNPTGESDALQLASLFENGQIIIWSVVKAIPAGRPLEKDGLLKPNGRVKMSKTMDYFLVGDRIILLNKKPVKSKRDCIYLLEHSQKAIDVTVERFLEVDSGATFNKRKVLLNFKIRTEFETRPFGLGVKTKKGRVVVTSIRENSVSADYFRIDDTIMMINNVQIDSKEKCRELIQQQKGIIDIVIEREEETRIEPDSYGEVRFLLRILD